MLILKGKVVRGLNYQCGHFQCKIGFNVIRPKSKSTHKGKGSDFMNFQR